MDRAERDTLIGVEVPDPNGGEPYLFKPLAYKDASKWLAELEEAQQNGHGGLLDPKTLDRFARSVETVDGTKLEDLPFTPVEVLQVAHRFLVSTRPGWSPWPAVMDSATEAEAPPSSTS